MFEQMSKYLKPAKFGKWEIQNNSWELWDNGRLQCGLISSDLKERKNCGEMSDSYQDYYESEEFINFVLSLKNPDVLIYGLGIYAVPFVIQKHCKTLDIVEIDQDLINHISSNVPISGNVKIYNDDVYSWKTEKKYDAIWVDISQGYDEKINYELSKTSSKFLNSRGKIFYWGNDNTGKYDF